MRAKHRFSRWFLAGTFYLTGTGSALACAFHGYSPNPTLIDVLLGTEQVVIAKPAAQDPASYSLIETLAGPEGLDIPIAVSATTRALLSGKPSSTVLLARDGAYGPWLEIAILDEGYRSFVTKVLKQQSRLLWGGDNMRLQLFAKLVNDPNSDVRRLAFQELDRAPYGDLKRLRLPRIRNLKQELRAGDSDLTPILVLLAGLSKDKSHVPFLTDGLDMAIRNDLSYMGAYATALIELRGTEAVDGILGRLTPEGGLSLQTREKLLQALAIQYKAAPGPTRRVIARGVADVLRDSDDLGGFAARQFGSTGRMGSLTLPAGR